MRRWLAGGLLLGLAAAAPAASRPGAEYYALAREGAQLYQQGEWAQAARVLRSLPAQPDLIAEKERCQRRLQWSLKAAQARGEEERTAELARELEGLTADLASLQAARPYDRAVRLRLADAWARTGFYDGAILLGRQLLRQREEPLLEAHLGDWLWRAGEGDEALERFGKAVEAARDPAVREIVELNLARALAETRGAGEALAFLEPRKGGRQQGARAALFFDAGKYEEAAAAFARLSAGDKSGASVINQARSYLAAGNYQALRKFCREHAGSNFEAVVGECRFLEALATFALGDYETAQAGLRRFLNEHPKAARAGEARLLLIDLLLATGKLEEANMVVRQIPVQAREYPAGLLKQAEILRRQGDAEGMHEYLLLVTVEEAGTPSAAEAWYRLGREMAENGDRAGAFKLFLEKAEELGNDPGALGVENMLRALSDLLPDGDRELAGRSETSELLGNLVERADQRGEELLAIRGLWANGLLFRSADPTVAAFYLKAAATRIDPARATPSLMIDVADGLRRAGEVEVAERFYRTIVARPGQPRAISRAHAGLGFIAAARGQEEAALASFDRFRSLGADPQALGDVLMTTAKLRQKSGDRKGSAAAWKKLMESEAVTPNERQIAAFALGDQLAEIGDVRESMKYYRKAAKSALGNPAVSLAAGLKLGLALEKEGEPKEATELYRELLGRADLKDKRQLEAIRGRLAKLEGAKS